MEKRTNSREFGSDRWQVRIKAYTLLASSLCLGQLACEPQSLCVKGVVTASLSLPHRY